MRECCRVKAFVRNTGNVCCYFSSPSSSSSFLQPIFVVISVSFHFVLMCNTTPCCELCARSIVMLMSHFIFRSPLLSHFFSQIFGRKFSSRRVTSATLGSVSRIYISFSFVAFLSFCHLIYGAVRRAMNEIDVYQLLVTFL